MSEILTLVFMYTSGIFMMLAAIGIIRMPSLFTRMHAATKVGAMGLTCAMLAVAFHFGDLGITTRALLVILFFLLTAPVAAHMIGRSAYMSGIPLARTAVVNEWPRPGVEPDPADPPAKIDPSSPA
ncbi:MAG TPA: monovalent cation/H(+) antiporter subunit G [Kiritimatiellia bacterium]|nr:monovalent cation/H(+) antiporter subunit G [Kiritimatiellia bacterium]